MNGKNYSESIMINHYKTMIKFHCIENHVVPT